MTDMLQDPQLTADPMVLRGLVSFIAASGPHRARNMVKNLRQMYPNDPARLARVLRFCDDARQKVSTMLVRNAQGELVPMPQAEQARLLNRLWSGLGVRSRAGQPVGGSVNGAEAQLEALALFHNRITEVIPIGARGLQLQDFFLMGGINTASRTALEVKSIQSRNLLELYANVTRIQRQFERWCRWVIANWNASPAAAADLRPRIEELIYVVRVNGAGNIPEAVIRRVVMGALEEARNRLVRAYDPQGLADAIPVLHPPYVIIG
jgi:hypothetical protein